MFTATLMLQGLRKQPDLPRQLALCPKKSFLCPENGQSRTKSKHKSNQTCHSKLGGYAACRQSLACSLASTLVLSSILLPQSKTLSEFWGKCVQIYRTTTGLYFNRLWYVAPVYVNRVAQETRRLTILRERDIPGTFSLPPSGYRSLLFRELHCVIDSAILGRLPRAS